MAINVITWLLAIPLLGFATGMRTMTPIAVLCWFAHFGLLDLRGTWGFWAGTLIAALVFTVLAIGEWVGDKLPNMGNRTDIPALLARLTFGGLVGALAAMGEQGPVLEGVILGVLGAAIGTFASFMIRRFFAEACGRHRLVAFIEDGIALLFSLLAMHTIAS